jgi:hypothetical protein
MEAQYRPTVWAGLRYLMSILQSFPKQTRPTPLGALCRETSTSAEMLVFQNGLESDVEIVRDYRVYL